jgi:hypothetical protein
MPDDLDWLSSDIRAAREVLPTEHRRLLDELRVQEKVVIDWPREVIDLYKTLLATPPDRSTVDGAAAVWLDELRTVAFNGSLFRRAAAGLDAPTRHLVVARVAWHEYGHALSVTRATRDHRDRGPELLTLLPAGLREAIDYPGRYRRSQVFDEIIATLYSVLVGRVRSDGYVRPEYLHPHVFAAFQEVIPWPRTR